MVTETYWALGQHKVGVKTSFEASKQETAHAFAKVISSGQLKLKTWNAEVDQFLHRLSFVEYHCPEYEIKSLRENEKCWFWKTFVWERKTGKKFAIVKSYLLSLSLWVKRMKQSIKSLHLIYF